ncbi:MAG TPA: apolipoprotein N-acyltransferase [Candidatus Obscuribacterales bacterium]
MPTALQVEAVCASPPARNGLLAATAGHVRNFARAELKAWIFCLVSGLLLAFAAPGFDQWYLAWFGLVPLLGAVFASSSLPRAFFRGLVFGTAYNMLYLHWVLFVHPATWVGLAHFAPYLMSGIAWLVGSLQQGLIIASFSAALRALPITWGILPVRSAGRWRIPALIAVPLLWILVLNKIGNAHDLLGVPWAMIEYSQYRQITLLQAASIVGGIGIGALIVLVNMHVLSVASSLSRMPSLKSIAYPSLVAAMLNSAVVLGLMVAALSYGHSRLLEADKHGGNEICSVLQGNISFTVHHATREAMIARYFALARTAPQSLCVWPEWAYPCVWSKDGVCRELLRKAAALCKQTWIVGTVDCDEKRQLMNGVVAVTDKGEVQPEVYHKRYLVPFGEYTPWLIKYSPFGWLFSTGAPGNSDYRPGDRPVVFSISGRKISPLVCFETISPELVAENVRMGAQLLVNCSNTVWFQSPIMGEQMIAFCVMRAAESHRNFVFATTIGPSAFIDAYGRVSRKSRRENASVLVDCVSFESDITPFCRWFF